MGVAQSNLLENAAIRAAHGLVIVFSVNLMRRAGAARRDASIAISQVNLSAYSCPAVRALGSGTAADTPVSLTLSRPGASISPVVCSRRMKRPDRFPRTLPKVAMILKPMKLVGCCIPVIDARFPSRS